MSGKAFYVTKPTTFPKKTEGGPKPHMGMSVFFVDSTRTNELQQFIATWRNNLHEERRVVYNDSIDEYNTKLERYKSLNENTQKLPIEVKAMKSAQSRYKSNKWDLDRAMDKYPMGDERFMQILAKCHSTVTDDKGDFSIILKKGMTYTIVAKGQNGTQWHFDYEANEVPLILAESNSTDPEY